MPTGGGCRSEWRVCGSLPEGAVVAFEPLIAMTVLAMNRSRQSLPATDRDSEAHLRSILATVPDAMVVIDEQGYILSFSAAAEKMFGFAEADVLDENVSMLMPSPDRERHDRYLADYLNTGERKIIGIGRVLTARHRDGHSFPIELSVGEAWMGERRIFTGFIRDLTERQRTELRLQDLQSELAHVGRVSEMGTLASSLAHELNQPLTAVTNYCESARDLLSGTPDSEILEMVREALNDAAGQAVRAGQIVRRLRDFISHGQTERRVESLAEGDQRGERARARRLSRARDRGAGRARPRRQPGFPRPNPGPAGAGESDPQCHRCDGR
jgi:PAS domain S-box-containing protein